jgi:hypothetical protein
MSNKLHKIQRDGRDAGMLPGRTFEKTQGCWNCIHFVTGREARKFWLYACRPKDEATAKSYEAAGVPQAAFEMRQLMKLAGEAIKTGGLGMCKIGKPPSDFVAHNYLCEDGWTGKQGASLAREGAAPDLTPGELRDIVDGSDDGSAIVEEAVAEAGLIVKP